MGLGGIKISIDKDLWRKFKRLASSRDQTPSEVLEELFGEELVVDLEIAVGELVSELETESNFKPVKAKTPISELVREMRNERK